MIRVAALYRYPVKSLGGESLQQAMVAERGFADDRRWMLVDEAGQFISQRRQHHLARYGARLSEEDTLEIFPYDLSKPPLRIADPRPAGTRDVEVTVWDDTFYAKTVAAPGIGAYLGLEDARLVYMDETVSRPVDPRYARDAETVSLADGYPYLITTTASLDALADRLGRPVDMLRFRPNIVLEGTTPFAEDGWTRIRIGNQRFCLPKPCARCVMVTLAPETGEKDLMVLSELARFRRHENKTFFGMNALALPPSDGTVRVGDGVEVLLTSRSKAIAQAD